MLWRRQRAREGRGEIKEIIEVEGGGAQEERDEGERGKDRNGGREGRREERDERRGEREQRQMKERG